MGRRRFRRRAPTPSESSEDQESAGKDHDVMLPVGAEVEVRSDEPGFAGSFYEATVAGHLPSSEDGGKRCTVVYSTLEGDDGEPFEEVAAAACVRPRPRPQRTPPRGFAVHDMVEALHSEGWWSGVVSKAPAPLVAGGDLRYQPRMYQVAFPTSRETLEFEEAALRPHRVFQGGRWVPAAQANNGNPLFRKGDQVDVSQSVTNFGESWNPATIIKVIGATNFLVQYMNNGKDEESATEILDYQYIRPARPINRMDGFSPSSHVEVLHEDSWCPGVILKVLGTGIDKYVVMLDSQQTDLDDVDRMNALMVDKTQLRLLYEWDGEKWVRCLKKESVNGPQLTSSKRPISAALYNDSDKINDEPGSRRDKKKLKNADGIPEQISPLLSVRNENSEITHKKGSTILAPRSELSLPSLSPMASFGCLSSSSSLAPSYHLAQPSSQIQASLFGAFGQPRPFPPGLPLGTQSLSSYFTSIEGAKKVVSDQDKQSAVGTGTELFRQMEVCVSFQTSVPLGKKPETPMKGITAKAVEEGCNVISVSEECSQSQEGNGTHDSCCPLSLETVAVHESIMETSDCLSESSAIQHLPLVKTSPLWTQLEALEIFKNEPQWPNLDQFQQHVPELHEGIALGLMLSFANLTESIERLGVQEDNGLLEQKMEGLPFLEANGFDVGDLRSHVEDLLRMKNSRAELPDALKRLEEEIAREEANDRELSTQLRALAMAVQHLELHAYLVRNIIKSAVAQRMNNAMEISKLKTEANNLSTAVPW